MSKNKYLLLCAHDHLQIQMIDKTNEEIDRNSVKKYLFHRFICDDCTKIVICIADRVEVKLNWIGASKDTFQWSLKSAELLVYFYKKRRLKHKCPSAEFWSQVHADMVEHGYKVSVEQCYAKIEMLIEHHIRVERKLQEIDVNSDSGLYFHLADEILRETADTLSEEQDSNKQDKKPCNNTKKELAPSQIFQEKRTTKKKICDTQKQNDYKTSSHEKAFNLIKEHKQLRTDISLLLDRGKAIKEDELLRATLTLSEDEVTQQDDSLDQDKKSPSLRGTNNIKELAAGLIFQEKRINKKKICDTKENVYKPSSHQKVLDLIKEQKQLRTEICHLLDRGEAINEVDLLHATLILPKDEITQQDDRRKISLDLDKKLPSLRRTNNKKELAATLIFQEKRANKKKICDTKENSQRQEDYKTKRYMSSQQKVLDLIKEQKQLRTEISHLLDRGEAINEEMEVIKEELQM